ncbi:uncharacterized protein LOC141599305 [Silene latifolia]|uniref:uncharacterized protein LOC141599305 n=1 Tax=Silene latifolia TaxID=37657 RepID=UPI003D772B6C
MKITEIDFQDYQLSSQLHGHEHDVRRICVCGNAGITTSSRDKTVRFWRIDPRNKNRYVESKVMVGHTSCVGPLAWIPPNQEFPEGGIVSGGMDTLVCVWDLKTGDRVQVLRGHTMQVTGIALDNGDIVSSSIDCTLKRWRNGKAVESWNAHKTAVQAVIKLPSGELATGSSDSTLKLWKGKTCVRTLVWHTDTVRDLAVMSDLGILSASHDGSVRLWALTGEDLMEMVGHTSIVYSVDSHISGLVASGSEDCLAKIWKDGFCVQTIEHPGCVWDVKFLENGDLVTACSDGVVRIWTTHQDRTAEPSEQESYLSQLSDYKISRKRVGGLKLEDLPGLDALQVPGTSDGQTKIVREGDNGVAYSWNMREHKWKKIAEVVDRAEDGIKRFVLDGREYEYVLTVDIGDGKPTRKLPYNRSDNPYDTVDKWLLKENLPLSYLQQIVDIILEHTGQKTVSFDPSFCDPYTGANAYVPGRTSSQNGNSRKAAFKHIPKKGFLIFDTAQFDGILKKVSEFNSTLLSDQDRRQLSLTELESSRLNAVVKILKDTSYYHSSTFADDDIGLLFKLLNSWPLSMIFPVIDILRMIILHPDGAVKLLKLINYPNDALLKTIKKATVKPGISANILTGLRAVTNLFKSSCFHSWLHNHRSEILDAFSGLYSSSSKHVQLAYSTLILNYAVLLTEKKDEEGQSQVLLAALEISESENAEVEAKFRALVAVGSLMLDGVVKRMALDFEAESIAKAAKASNEAKLAEVGADIELLAQRTKTVSSGLGQCDA